MRWFFSEAIPSAKIPITRVEIGSASIVGELDLEGLNIAFLFCFKNCDFKEKINLSDATIIGFDMVGGTATEILADRLFVKGAMRLHAFGAKAPPRLCKLRLCGAEIRGNLDLRGCGLADAKRSLPLFADGLAVHGHVLLSGQASQDLGVHPSQLRDWVKKFADDPQHAFPGHGQMNPAMVASMRVPAIYPFREYVQSGGLVSYGANLPDMYRRAANYVDSLHPSSPPRATLL